MTSIRLTKEIKLNFAYDIVIDMYKDRAIELGKINATYQDFKKIKTDKNLNKIAKTIYDNLIDLPKDHNLEQALAIVSDKKFKNIKKENKSSPDVEYSDQFLNSYFSNVIVLKVEIDHYNSYSSYSKNEGIFYKYRALSQTLFNKVALYQYNDIRSSPFTHDYSKTILYLDGYYPKTYSKFLNSSTVAASYTIYLDSFLEETEKALINEDQKKVFKRKYVQTRNKAIENLEIVKNLKQSHELIKEALTIFLDIHKALDVTNTTGTLKKYHPHLYKAWVKLYGDPESTKSLTKVSDVPSEITKRKIEQYLM